MSRAEAAANPPTVVAACRRVSIVVPTYKEAQNIVPLVRRIAQAMANAGLDYEIIVVDDNSRDGTDERVAELANELIPVRLITRTDQRGLSSAVLRGFNEARGEVLVCMDADLSHPPEDAPKLIAALSADNVDFVIGSRYVKGGRTDGQWGVLRWLNSRLATVLARPFTKAKDPMAGYFALPRHVFERADALNPVGYKIGLELMVKCRVHNLREIPIYFADRQQGESKLSLREQLYYLRHLKRLADYRFGAISKFMQFCTVGATGMVVDLTTYATLLTLLPSSLLPLSRALAIWCAMTWNFVFNRRITFSDRRQERVLRQYACFVVSCVLGMLLSWYTAVALTYRNELFAQHELLAAVVGIIVGTVTNFTLSSAWVFRRNVSRLGHKVSDVGGE